MPNYNLNPICRKCGYKHNLDFTNVVNVSNSPEIKEEVLSGEYFTWTCPDCGTKNLLNINFLYIDNNIQLLMTDAALSEETKKDFSPQSRQVKSFGELIEKIKIADCGLDDIVIEMCKYVTTREMPSASSDITLRFLQLDGADGDIIFAYPQDDQMQGLRIGFNVYEDCAGIINRNPVIRNSVHGLECIDKDWIERFFN